MAGEKNFENRLKKWLEDEGIYPLGEPVNRMSAPPCGYWEKRWGGGRYVKSGLPDMRIVVKGLALEVELKATIGAHDAYALGAKVSHKEKHWTSTVANNVWEPGVYGWEEATDGV